jgi:hypothetical protein
MYGSICVRYSDLPHDVAGAPGEGDKEDVDADDVEGLVDGLIDRPSASVRRSPPLEPPCTIVPAASPLGMDLVISLDLFDPFCPFGSLSLVSEVWKKCPPAKGRAKPRPTARPAVCSASPERYAEIWGHDPARNALRTPCSLRMAVEAIAPYLFFKTDINVRFDPHGLVSSIRQSRWRIEVTNPLRTGEWGSHRRVGARRQSC